MKYFRIRLMRTVLITLPLLAGVAVAAAESSWLPPRVEQGMVQQLAKRITLLDDGTPKKEKILLAARKTVSTMKEIVDSWGVSGVLERAPELSALNLPTTDDRYLDAMIRYQICNALLVTQLQHPAFQGNQSARITSVFGLTGITMVVVRLREPFVGEGGDQAEIEARLTSPGLEPTYQAIQADAELRRHAESACQPVLNELLEKPLTSLDADP